MLRTTLIVLVRGSFKLSLEHLLSALSKGLACFDEVGHKELVADECEPCEGECWVVIGVQILEQISQVEKDLALHLLLEALSHGDRAQDHHQNAVVGLLIEDFLLREVIVVQLLPDEFEDF